MIVFSIITIGCRSFETDDSKLLTEGNLAHQVIESVLKQEYKESVRLYLKYYYRYVLDDKGYNLYCEYIFMEKDNRWSIHKISNVRGTQNESCTLQRIDSSVLKNLYETIATDMSGKSRIKYKILNESIGLRLAYCVLDNEVIDLTTKDEVYLKIVTNFINKYQEEL